MIQPPQFNPKQLFAHVLKNLKKELPKECTHLSPFKNSKGESYVRAIVNNTEYLITIPPNFVYKTAHINELRNKILEKCS